MKRIRAAAIVLKDSQLLLMQRVRDGKEYFVFPGGGIEEGETAEQATVREVWEETSLKVNIDKYVYHGSDEKGEQKFFLCSYVSGTPQLGYGGNERAKMNEKNSYKPGWYDIKELSDMLIYPFKIRDELIADLRVGFQDGKKEVSLLV